ERLHLLPVERRLLLQPSDRQLARVRRFARRRRARVRLGQLEAQALERGLDRGQVRRGCRLARPGAGERRPGRVDRLAEQAVTAGELHLLPAPQLFAQPLVAPRLRRLPLERAALLLHLENDVVDARQVLLRGLELQLRRAAPRLVFRHAGRFLDQLPAIRRTRAQDLADLPLLDHRIRLDAETRVHQQVLHVFQAHDLAVDQVFAFPRAIEPPRQLDVADDRRILVEDRLLRRHLDDELAGRLPVPRHARRDARQPQAHLRRRRRLPPVAPLEDDVLHVLAAQALRALLAEHPGDRVDDVALPAAAGADAPGDAGADAKLRARGKTPAAGG